MGAPPWGSPPLLTFLPERRLHGGEACPLRLGVGLPAWPRGGTTPRAPRRSRVPRWPRLEAQAARPLHALSLCSAPELCAARVGARSRVGRGRSRRKDRLLPRPSSRGPRGDRAAGVNYVLVQPAPLFRERGAPSSSPARPAANNFSRLPLSHRGGEGFKRHQLRGPRPPRPTHPLSGPPEGNTPRRPARVFLVRALPTCPSLTLTGAPTLIASAPPSFCRPRPSLERPVYYFLLLPNQAPQDPFRTLTGSP
ncbi:atherin-like [Lutra lutra]|uniref:atherin-like n=1 Tax=Lutra lutra TaxID=9657 RepID=UPI001FD19A60|nr:atherin-like [Lutra lutra]